MRVSSLLSTAFYALLALTTNGADAAPVSAPDHALEKRGPNWGFPFGSTKIRGVNIGGWLLLEFWITPSLISQFNDKRIVDEYTFGKYVDRNTAHGILTQHWDTFITFDDFQAIKNAGLNFVRLPIGYWAWDVSAGEPYHQGQLYYLNQAVSWARKLRLHIMLDLHALPGSQNGFDNSGQEGAVTWHQNKDNVSRSLAVIKAMALWYAGQADVVSAIEVVNEASGWTSNDFLSVLKQYYYDSYGSIRYPFGTGTQAAALQVISDAFMGPDYWKGFETGGFDGVMIDYHYYSIWDGNNNSAMRRTFDQHIAAACAFKSTVAKYSDLWAVGGEWSTAVTDCPYKSTRGSSYDGTAPGSTYIGSCSDRSGNGANFSAEFKTFMRKYFEAQTSVFDATTGWIYWTWKTESADEWSYSKGLQYGWIPQDPTERLYPNICG